MNLTDKPNIAFEIRKPLEHHCIILYHSLGMGKAFSVCQDSSKAPIELRLIWRSFSGEYGTNALFFSCSTGLTQVTRAVFCTEFLQCLSLVRAFLFTGAAGLYPAVLLVLLSTPVSDTFAVLLGL